MVKTLAPPDLDRLRRDFPITDRVIYLDNAGVAPTPSPVVEAVNRFLREYSQGGLMRHWDFFEEVVGDLQRGFGGLFGAEPDELVPIAHASEGINGVAHALGLSAGDNVITSDLEFPSNFYPWVNLERRGVEVRVVRHHRGILGIEDIEPFVDGATRVITLTSVAFLSGFRMDVASVARFARERGIVTVLDATQALGALRTDLHELAVDAAACSGMKWLLGPLGSGVLYIRRDMVERLVPAYVSWLSLKERHAELQRHLELASSARRFLLSGNIDLAAFAGLARAIRYLEAIGPGAIETRVLSLVDQLVAGLQRLGLQVLSPLDPAVRSGIVTFQVADPDSVLAGLRERGIYAVQRMGGIRVSPHFYNTEEEIDAFLTSVDEQRRS